MTKVTYTEKFDTSFGKVFIFKNDIPIVVEQEILIEGEKYIVEKIQLQNKPNKDELLAIFV